MVQPDGKIVVAGADNTPSDFAVVRYTAGGGGHLGGAGRSHRQ